MANIHINAVETQTGLLINIDGDSYVVTKEHVNYEKIKNGLDPQNRNETFDLISLILNTLTHAIPRKKINII